MSFNRNPKTIFFQGKENRKNVMQEIEIKFRGKTVDTGRWVYGYLVKDWEGNTYIISKFGPDITGCSECGVNKAVIHKVIPETVGQFTGIRDRNGVEVYVGDKIKALNGINEIIGIVRFGEYEQNASGGAYGTAPCVGFYVERLKAIPNEWEAEEGLLYEPDYEKTNSLLAYEWIEVLK